MKNDAEDLIAALEAGASTADACEKRYRSEAAREIERLERERVTAFRRIRLARLIAPRDNADEAAALQAGRLAVANEFGWNPDSETHKPVLDRLDGVIRAIWSARQPAVLSPLAALGEFEAWYQGHAGQSFYALFDQYVPETPLVDF